MPILLRRKQPIPAIDNYSTEYTTFSLVIAKSPNTRFNEDLLQYDVTLESHLSYLLHTG